MAVAADAGFNNGGLMSSPQQTLLHRTQRTRICWPVALFLIALVVPWIISVGPLRMSVYRCILLAMVLPCLVTWLVGKAGKMRIADIAILLFWLWSLLSFVANHGLMLSIEPAGIEFVETVGAYLLARCYVRDADAFYSVVQTLFRIVLVLMPFALVELVSGHNFLRELFATILPTEFYPSIQRSSLTRVTSVFDHPILFGVCSGSIVALVYLVLGYKRNYLVRCFKALIVAGVAFMSLSAGPISVLISQGFLLVWNALLRHIKSRWVILIALTLFLVLLIEVVAKRSALNIVVSSIVFDPASYWYRTLIWHYGSETVLSHPLFGVGLNDWERPAWMPAESIDNFWLFRAIRGGVPAAFLMMLAFFSIFLAVSFKKGLNEKLLEYRTAFLITMVAFFQVGWTVHFWGAAYVLFLFLLGSGVWMLDTETKSATASRPERPVKPGLGGRGTPMVDNKFNRRPSHTN
jgi:O-antigen ligase